ncbi:MAG TPA: hypothetical protein VFY06_05930 [Verrucomicrobiae bacterium]|nr:hypothetical protein [Verrucomicrobiae bacterium]
MNRRNKKYIVRRAPDGDIKWKEIVQVRSLKEFVREREQHFKERGANRRYLSIVSENQVDCWDENGKLIESFLLCEKYRFQFRLVSN